VAAIQLTERGRIGRLTHELRIGSIAHTPLWSDARNLYPV
jgi:hypothetical protein